MSRFDKVEGVALAPVVDRKNARVCLVVKLSVLSVPLFKLVSETGNQVLKHEKAEEHTRRPAPTCCSRMRTRSRRRKRKSLFCLGRPTPLWFLHHHDAILVCVKLFSFTCLIWACAPLGVAGATLHVCTDVHFHPEVGELRGRLRSAAAVWPDYPDGVGFLLGDFNISDPNGGRFKTRTQTF